jgi:putative transposase
MIRDTMVHCIERHVAGAISGPAPRQRIDLRRHKTIDITLALNLQPCFTPVESPESNGMAEAFVKTFKRDYIRVNPTRRHNGAHSDRSLDGGTTRCTRTPRLGYGSPREYISAQSQPAASPV